MINYILQVLLFQALFLAVYDFFLQKETFFKWNRVYLLATPFISFIIPLLKFDKFKQAVPEEYMVQLPTVFLNPEAFIVGTNSNDTSIDYLAIIFYLGIIVFSLLFLFRLIKIVKLISSNEVIKENIYSLVLLKTKQSAFSFFNYIFINKQLIEKKELEIIQHELVHCRQKHSIDLLVFEILKIVLWFNPLIYVFQKRITLLHEYISDAEVVKETDKKTYFNKLLSETFSVESISFTNQFFKHSLIKKRIVMITKERSQKMKQLKYLLIVPLLAIMLVMSSFENKEDQISTIISEVIDEDLTNELLNLEVNNLPFEKDNSTIQKKIKLNKISLKKADTIRPKVSAGSVPFAIIDEVPVFPGCEGDKSQLRDCIQEKITAHVSANFNAKIAKGLGLKPGVKRIFVMFKIDKKGNVLDLKARASHKALEKEAIRVVKMLPKMIPGKQNGKPVAVKYSLPIAVWISDDAKTTKSNKKIKTYKDGEDVPFAIIEEVPIYPGCEGTKPELRKCLQDKITKHINRKFNADLASKLELSPGVKRIFVMFKIDKEGNIVDVMARAPHKLLQEEAIRVVKLLPKMIPGKQRGKNVGVKYSLPIAFKVSDDVKAKKSDTKVNEYNNGEDVPFAIIEEVPIYPGCEGTKSELRKCLQNKITSHVNRKFNADLASKLDLSPGVKRIFVMFKIDKEGNIADVMARAPHKLLQEEAIRVVKLLPKMIPGKQRGKNVGVTYSLPIAFKIEGNNKNKNEQKFEKGEDVPFAIIDEVPVYPGCEGTKVELRACIQDKITAHVNKNFNVKKLLKIDLGTGLKRIFVMFKIDKGGNISEVKSRASHPALQEEAIRVVKLLPKMIPGKQKGKPVGVKYSLPIAFKVE